MVYIHSDTVAGSAPLFWTISILEAVAETEAPLAVAEPGIVGLAVPVSDGVGRVVAGLAVHAPLTRTTVADARARISLFQQTAQRLGAALDGAQSGVI